ncbi:DUF368 domain-containing protein [Ferrimonas marina]|uniref:Putative membrane protein n=1 Tax=Ferrimonas marina TaxID=299255 RepID=A0A1M5RAW2_9GAMM|nr:DUF368 domain-containing protein [Ferrimonas marina]SHH22943.1 putative membrane protein [Ferrimonas marina]
MKIELSTFFKGMAMGAADVVPGVSGGTIAFISGIYDRLLESIRRINPSLIGLARKQGARAAWQHIDGAFLLTLFGGIAVSILSLAKLISYLLVAHPVPLWSFFFGLITISLVHIAKQVPQHNLASASSALVGFLLAWLLTVSHPLTLDASGWNLVLGGMLAICAMILPGISGSFILLLLGLYTPVIGAIKGLEIGTLALFACGCVLGLLTFSHLLSYLLKRFRSHTLSFLCGLMLGTLNKVWPWKVALSTRINSSGEEVAVTERALTPWGYESVTGQDPQLLLAIAAMALGVLLVWGLERYAGQTQDADPQQAQS